ncbi:metallophosphoesterase [Candidimonas sp. SYP-B2681]|nr:metallophosphoesterase [Candidimonas sp. SYP-B2681]RTZ44807.1 metallophosphoesterase [Candidimonas sp. SYP-B2681]
MRLNVLSDLHLSKAGMPLPETDADIVILAGDIARPKEALQWAQGFNKPVLYVAGNHEFYGGSIESTLQDLRDNAAGTGVRILSNTEVVLHGIRFLGSTLWTDFNLYGQGAKREQAITEALAFIRDFSRIRSDTSPGHPFSPHDMEILFHANRAWLREKLDQRFNGPTVVITHHAPSRKSIHPRFEGSLINNCFVSDSEDLMAADRAAVWIHGHTHDSFDYLVNETRVVCNPRGYAKDGINENSAFNPELIIEVPAT